LYHTVVSSGFSRPGIIDTRPQYRAVTWRLRNTALHVSNKQVHHQEVISVHAAYSIFHACMRCLVASTLKRLDIIYMHRKCYMLRVQK